MLARAKISTASSVASVTIENAGYIPPRWCWLLLTGTWFLFQRADVPRLLEQAAEVVVIGALVAAIVGLWRRAHARRCSLRLDPLLAAAAGKSTNVGRDLRDVETRIYDVAPVPAPSCCASRLGSPPSRGSSVGVGWCCGSCQAARAPAWWMRSCWNRRRFVTVVFKFIPYRLGVDEAGWAPWPRCWEWGPVTGVTLALVGGRAHPGVGTPSASSSCPR